MEFNMMESRYVTLCIALAGYIKTGIPLILKKGNQLLPAMSADDIGIYCIIPKISYYFSLPLNDAIKYFFNGILIISFLIGIIGLLLYFSSWLQRTIGVTWLLILAKITAEPMDVYRISACVIVGTLPLFIYFIQKNHTSKWFYPFMVYAGAFASFSHYIRVHSGTPIIIFITIMIATQPNMRNTYKGMLYTSFIFGILIPISYFKYEWHQHVNYAKKSFPQYQIDNGVHVFWHPIYLGFGFIQNEFGILYDDHIADLKIKSIDPSTVYPSFKSEQIMRSEVFKLIRKDYFFVLRAIGAKLGIILLLFILCTNIGILGAFFYPKGWRLESAFFAALSFSMLSGILTIPYHFYLLGFIALSALYGMISLNFALDQRDHSG